MSPDEPKQWPIPIPNAPGFLQHLESQGPDDRKWLMSLSELEREKVIADRKDKRAIALEAWQLRQAKKKQETQAPRTNRRQVRMNIQIFGGAKEF